MNLPLNEGDPVAEIIRPGGRRKLAGTTTVATVTPTIIVTADGRRWNATTRTPLGAGARATSRLLSAHDDEPVALRAQEAIRQVAAQATNLHALDRTKPEDVAADLALIARAAAEARRAVITMMTEASRAQTSSPR